MRRVIVSILALSLAGCDPVYGVSRSALLDTFPSLDCMRAAVVATPGVVNVQYRQEEGGTALTLSGLKPEEPTHSFIYKGSENSELSGALQVHRDHRGTISLVQTHLAMNTIPTQKSIDVVRPVMLHIEHDLAINCGLPELPARVTEWCHGVQCGP